MPFTFLHCARHLKNNNPFNTQAAEKTFWCQRPPHLSTISIEAWRNLSNSQDNCNILDTNWDLVTNPVKIKINFFSNVKKPEKNQQNFFCLKEGIDINNNNSTAATKCASWEFDSNDNLGNTWISEWNLVCDKEYLKNVGEMFFLVGVAAGGIISGYLSDRFGRKHMLFISVVLQTIFGKFFKYHCPIGLEA